MRFVFALLLLLLAGVFGNEQQQKGWIVATWEDSRLLGDQITRDFNVHAIFNRVALIVGFPKEIDALKLRGFGAYYARVFNENEKLFGLEFDTKYAEVISRAFAHWEIYKNVVFKNFPYGLAVVSSDKFLDNVKYFDWASKIESLPLPTKPIIPGPRFNESPLYNRFSTMNMSVNPIIEKVLRDVSSQELYNVVYHLSEEFYTRQSASEELKEAQKYLIETFASFGLNTTTHDYNPDYAHNICADLVGIENPHSLVVVGAHYDSRSIDTNDPTLRAPGACDNGSGTAGMVEIARVLRLHGLSFSNTIRICVWTGEEQGLLGSDAYAKKIKAEGAEVLAYFNADMTGYQLPGTPITLGMKDKSITEWLLELSFEISKTYVPDMPVALSASCCSDYISFFNQGYPSIGYFQNAGGAGDYPDYHKETDTIDKLNFDQVKMQTQAIMAALLEFAVPL